MSNKHLFLSLFFSFQSAFCALVPIEEAPIAAEYWRQIFYKNGNTLGTYKVIKTILTPEGISEVSNLTFSYNQKDRFRILKAEVMQPHGNCIQLKPSQVDKRLEEASVTSISKVQKISFLFPKLEVGSKVEIIYEHDAKADWQDPIGILECFVPANERIDSLLIEYISDKPWFWKSEHTHDFDIHVSQDKKTLKIQQKNPRYYWCVKEALGGYIRDYPVIALNTTEDLEKALYGLISAWNKVLTEKLPAILAEVVKGCANKPPEERVIDILHYIRDHYRYLGDWRGEKRGRQPFSLSKTVKHGYGDCKDLSTILVAMLRASGIKADPAILYRGVGPPKMLLPSVLCSNHAVVRVEVGEKVWWLDPTNVAFLPDHTPLDIHDRDAVVLLPKEKIFLTQTPRVKPEEPEKIREVTQVYGIKNQVVVREKTTYHGRLAQAWIEKDYLEGMPARNRRMTPKDVKNFEMQRDKVDFLVPKSYQVKRSFVETVINGPGPSTTMSFYGVAYFPLLKVFRTICQYAIDNNGKADISLNEYASETVQVIFKHCQLINPAKTKVVTSPWVDCSVRWYDSKEDGGCVCETRFIRKVDWLDCKTLNSSEFKQFLKEVSELQKETSQAIVYSQSDFYRKLEKSSHDYPELYELLLKFLGFLVPYALFLCRT